MYQPPSWVDRARQRRRRHVPLRDDRRACSPQRWSNSALRPACRRRSSSSPSISCRPPNAGCSTPWTSDRRATSTRPTQTGQACREMYPAPRAQWHTAFETTRRRFATVLPAGSVDLTFIDANHSHPFPLLDLLQATAFAKPGSWVILHDVDLPIQHPQFQIYGPRWLFQSGRSTRSRPSTGGPRSRRSSCRRIHRCWCQWRCRCSTDPGTGQLVLEDCGASAGVRPVQAALEARLQRAALVA